MLSPSLSHMCCHSVALEELSDTRAIRDPCECFPHQVSSTTHYHLSIAPTARMMATVLSALARSENKTIAEPKRKEVHDATKEEFIKALVAITPAELNEVTTLPIPTLEKWQTSSNNDHDISLVMKALRTEVELDTTEIREKRYSEGWRQGQFEVDNGILYKYETSKRANLRQIRTRVVPEPLRQTVFSAFHASPMGGHSSIHKTYWRIAARYWWPNMASDIRKAVQACAYCVAANLTNHEAQQQLRTFDNQAPFDVLVMDAWSPGKLPYPDSKHRPKSVLTGLCTLTGFAGVAFLNSDDSHEAAMKAFQAFFIPRGLPKLVIVDAGSQFAGLVERMCGQLGIPFHTVTRENHRAILCERFHKFLNKVQRIHLRQCCSMDEWIKGTLFAVYAWNSAPIDGTNIVRSVAAIGRDFPFPIDTEQDRIATPTHANTGHQILDHVSAAFPLLASQRTILRALIEDRRAHHRDLKNRARNEKKFFAGDMVIVRKQVTTGDTYGPAKLRLRARGPYRVLEQLDGGGSYKIQRMPFSSTQGRQGKPTRKVQQEWRRSPPHSYYTS